MKDYNTGIDVGNFDTKSPNTVTPSGFVSYKNPPYNSKECLFIDETYYEQSENRFPYIEDKTVNDNMYILTLFAISKEIIFEAEKNIESKLEQVKVSAAEKHNLVQEYISSITKINLGIGLPVSHYSRNKETYINYYITRMNNGIFYEYGGYTFSYSLNKINCYPQDLSAVSTYKTKNKNSILNMPNPTYYAIDIGGWTVDIISVIKNRIDGKGASKPLGVLAMYEKIINDIDIQTGIRVEATDIEDILRGNESFLSDETKNIIYSDTKLWVEDIINVLVQNGILIQTRPVLFIGGGSQLLKKYLKESERFTKHEFISNSKVNARGYAKLISKL